MIKLLFGIGLIAILFSLASCEYRVNFESDGLLNSTMEN